MGFKCPACGLDFGTDKTKWELHLGECNGGLAKALVLVVTDAATKRESKKAPSGRIRIDTYYDITCDCCCRSWSTDFNGRDGCMDKYDGGGMGMETNRNRLYKLAKKLGWTVREGKTFCPECAKSYDGGK